MSHIYGGWWCDELTVRGYKSGSGERERVRGREKGYVKVQRERFIKKRNKRRKEIKIEF